MCAIQPYATQHNSFRKVLSLPAPVEFIGSLAALITTLAWLPQIVKILRERRTHDISLGTNATLAAGVFLWFVYGLFISSWPVMAANGVTLVFLVTILGLKLRFG
jgi:MtN3 and saliva related transmembrane protein